MPTPKNAVGCLPLKLGKTPATKNPADFQLKSYLVPKPKKLPKPPPSFGHEALIPRGKWGMDVNDRLGCCVIAAGAHSVRLWNAMAGRPIPEFNDECIIEDYKAVGGYNPNDPSTDQGCNMRTALSFRRRTGALDATGKRHKIAAFLSLTPTDLNEWAQAMYLFGSVEIGIRFPRSAMDQFNAHQPWKPVARSPIEGGHDCLVVSRRPPYLDVVTWGTIEPMSGPFAVKYCDEIFVALSDEMLNDKGLSPELFNRNQLIADLSAL